MPRIDLKVVLDDHSGHIYLCRACKRSQHKCQYEYQSVHL